MIFHILNSTPELLFRVLPSKICQETVLKCLDRVTKTINKLPSVFTFIWVNTHVSLSPQTESTLSSIFRQTFYRASSVQFSSVALSHVQLCNPMDCNTIGFPVHHQLPEPTQTRVHWVDDAIQPYPLLSHSPAFNISQHQGLFKWVSSSHQVATVLKFRLQHQSFQWIFRTDFL